MTKAGLYQTIDGKAFKAKKDHVVAISEPRKDGDNYKFTVELTSGLYIFVIKGKAIDCLVNNPTNNADNELDAMYLILGRKIGRFIGRAVKYGLENATDTVKNWSLINQRRERRAETDEQ